MRLQVVLRYPAEPARVVAMLADPEFSRRLAALADIFVCDAFGTAHRAHAGRHPSGWRRACDAGACMQARTDAAHHSMDLRHGRPAPARARPPHRCLRRRGAPRAPRHSGAPAIPAAGTLVAGLASQIKVSAAVDPDQGGDATLLRDGGINGAEVKVETARESVSLSLSDMDNGSWVIFELPGFKTAAAGAERSSLAALRDASDTSYYKDGDTLWVKLVTPNTPGTGGAGGGLAPRASVEVRR